MKSAYEKAMERLAKESPSRTLSDEEKTEIAELDKKMDAQVAEAKLSFDAKMAVANPVEAEVMHQELVAEVARIEEKREADKDAIWKRA
ncbi:MAG: hypothetical protein VCD00_16155 [Candidatus Hydrogenedentota bacterium]